MRNAMILALFAAVLAGCASSKSGSVYSRDEARREQTVRLATVESVRTVLIEGTRSGVGTAAGGVVGGIAGSEVGRGKGAAVGAVLGAVAGGVAGSAIEEGATRRDGLEITVRLDSGGLRAIVQEADEQFKPGERVRLVTNRGVTRVTH